MTQLFEIRTCIRLVQSIQWLEEDLGNDDESMKWRSLKEYGFDKIIVTVLLTDIHSRIYRRYVPYFDFS